MPRHVQPHLVALVFVLASSAALGAAHGAESLWTAETMADGTLYSDQVARRVGDLVTVLVKESTAITDKNKTKTDRKDDISAELQALPTLQGVPAKTLPKVDATSASKFEGEGNYEHTGEVRSTVTARVVDVLDNGNLVVEGRRQVKVNDDTKTIRITGVIRSADIRSDNTVLSEKLHGFEMAIEGDGPLTQANQRGWLATVFEKVKPW